MNVMGQETYQVDGKAREVELEYEIEIPDEDVEMVANSAGVSEDEARQALEECKGRLCGSNHEIKSIDTMTLIAHISDLHISNTAFDEEVFMNAVTEINNLKPDMIILTGDITDNGYYVEFQQATKYLEMFEAPLFAVQEIMMPVIWVIKPLKN